VFFFQELTTGNSLEINNMEYNTKLMIIKALRAHSGLYTIKAKNSVGEDTATFDITILGKKI